MELITHLNLSVLVRGATSGDALDKDAQLLDAAVRTDAHADYADAEALWTFTVNTRSFG